MKYFPLLILIISCSSFKNLSIENQHKITQYKVDSSFLQLIPSIGLVIQSDTIKLWKIYRQNFLSLIDTNTISYEIRHPKSEHIVRNGWESIPKCNYWTHKSNITFNNITFKFKYFHTGLHSRPYTYYKDSLILYKITISKKKNAGINDSLKIGDNFKNIINFFPQSRQYRRQLISSRDKYENGNVIFIIGVDSVDAEYFQKIKEITVK